MALSTNAATIAGDGIASFALQTAGTGDITNNPNGLSIAGQSGAWGLGPHHGHHPPR